jgi:S-DNA-T family DNA segregation ATPase FtsK/SpoIIIE
MNKNTIFYGVDATGQDMKKLESLKSVGSIININDEERIARLFTYLLEEIRSREHESKGYEIVLLLDGLNSIKDKYELEISPTFADLKKILRDGPRFGVWTIATSINTTQLPTNVFSLFTDHNYMKGQGKQKSIPKGRVLYKGLEGQLFECDDSLFGKIANHKHHSNLQLPKRIESLTTNLPLESLEKAMGGKAKDGIVIGIEYDSMQPKQLALNQQILITGKKGSGKTTALETMLHSLADYDIFFISRNKEVKSKFNTMHPNDDLLVLLDKMLEEKLKPEKTCFVFEGVSAFSGEPAEEKIVNAIKRARRQNITTIIEENLSLLSSSWDIYSELKLSDVGLFLMPSQSDTVGIFNTLLPKDKSRKVVGRGYLVDSASNQKLQVAYKRT